MRKHKLLFLFVVVSLCVSMLLTGCNLTGNENPDPDPTPDETPEEPKLPDLLSYFVIDSTDNDYYVENKLFTNAEAIEGDIIWVETPDGTELMATVAEDVDHFNNDVIEVKLYRNGAVLYEFPKVSYSLSENVEKKVDLYFDDGILIFEVASLDYTDGETTYSRSYYQYSDTAAPTKLYDGTDVVEYKVIGNLTVVVGTEIVRWYGSENQTVFEMSSDFYYRNGFAYGYEYGGYLYFAGDKSLYIYDKDGACVVEYNSPANSKWSSFSFLNNGNVVIQEDLVVLDMSAEADFNYIYGDGTRIKTTTNIMNYKTGALTDKTASVDFWISNLESAYSAEKHGTDFSFELVDGKQNQAVIYRFDKDGDDDNGQYVVIDNDLNVEFVFPIIEPNLDVDSLAYEAYAIGDKYIVAGLFGQYGSIDYAFDYYGNVVKCVPQIEYISDKYIVCDGVVYDLDFNLIYVASENNLLFFEEESGKVFINNKICVEYDFNHDGESDLALLDPASGELKVLQDNLNAIVCDIGNSYYVLCEFCDQCKAHYDECELSNCRDEYCTFRSDCAKLDCNACVHSIYNAEGTLLLESSRGCIDVEEHNNSLYVTVSYYDYMVEKTVKHNFVID